MHILYLFGMRNGLKLGLSGVWSHTSKEYYLKLISESSNMSDINKSLGYFEAEYFSQFEDKPCETSLGL